MASGASESGNRNDFILEGEIYTETQ